MTVVRFRIAQREQSSEVVLLWREHLSSRVLSLSLIRRKLHFFCFCFDVQVFSSLYEQA